MGSTELRREIRKLFCGLRGTGPNWMKRRISCSSTAIEVFSFCLCASPFDQKKEIGLPLTVRMPPTRDGRPNQILGCCSFLSKLNCFVASADSGHVFVFTEDLDVLFSFDNGGIFSGIDYDPVEKVLMARQKGGHSIIAMDIDGRRRPDLDISRQRSLGFRYDDQGNCFILYEHPTNRDEFMQLVCGTRSLMIRAVSLFRMFTFSDRKEGIVLATKHVDGQSWDVVCYDKLLQEFGRVTTEDSPIGFHSTLEKIVVYNRLWCIRAIDFSKKVHFHGVASLLVNRLVRSSQGHLFASSDGDLLHLSEAIFTPVPTVLQLTQ